MTISGMVAYCSSAVAMHLFVSCNLCLAWQNHGSKVFNFSFPPQNNEALDWIVQCFTSLPTQYRLYRRRFYKSKNPTNSIKVLKKMLQRQIKQRKHKIQICTDNNRDKKDIHKISTTSPLVYSNMR